SGVFPVLPVGIADPVERLASIREQMDVFKGSGQAVAGDVLTKLSGFAPPMLLSLSARLGFRFEQRLVQTVATNVPGPQFPLYAAGRQMVYSYPYVPIAGSVRIAIAIFSYLGGLNFGVTGDWDSVQDIEVLTRGIEEGMAELVEAARRPRSNSRPAAPRTGPRGSKTRAVRPASPGPRGPGPRVTRVRPSGPAGRRRSGSAG
ncbi:MAG: WSD1 family O-acyltransferase, partial [Candidatus Dormibacteraeota bacterium]|nr:WSD1 family O-acyltransferase [Candidatus Dormibacteraeota bacterium]